MKYSKQLVLNYINGNDIDIDIELLEKDYNFMLDVLKLTRDKKIINFCDDELLNDGKFIFEVLDIFKEDRLFCIQLESQFIKYNGASYDIDTINVALKAQDINNDRYLEEFTSLSLYLKVAYLTIKISIEKQIKDEDIDMDFNYGIILSNYPYDELFKKFIAINMIQDIFSSLGSLEYYIKSYYKTPDYIYNIGSKQFIIDLLRGHDKDLADYTEFHIELINNKIFQLDSIINDWKQEINNYEDEIYEIISLFWEQNNEIDLDDYIRYIAKELNLPNLLENTTEAINESLIDMGYDPMINYKLIDEEIEEEFYEEIDDITKEKLFNKLKKGVLIYLENNKRNMYNEINNQNKSNTKILKFQKKNKDIKK